MRLNEIFIKMVFMLTQIKICKTCVRSELESSGMFKIVGMFSVASCMTEETDFIAVLMVESMKYTVKKANERLGKGLIGYQIYDTGIDVSLDLLANATLNTLYFIQENYDTNGNICVCSKNLASNDVLGIVGLLESSHSIFVHQFTAAFYNLTLVSNSATSVELSDKSLYPNFYRTIPPDNYQADAIASLMLFFNWTYVSILAIDNTYGRTGAQILNEKFQKHNICVSVNAIFSQGSSNEYKEIASSLKNSANVIIVWGFLLPILEFLKEANTSIELSNKTWVISEANQHDPRILKLKSTFRGTIILVLSSIGVDEEFKEYFLNLTYGDADPWLKTVFDKINNESKTTTRIYDLDYKFTFVLANAVQIAVEVFVNALENYQKDVCKSDDCTIDLSKNRDDFNMKIKEVNVSTLQNTTFRFDDENNPEIARYDFYLVDESRFISFAHWSSEDSFQMSNKIVVNSLKVDSYCSQPCPAGQYAVYDPQQTCCWVCKKCPENQAKAETGQHECQKCQAEEYPDSKQSKCIKLTRVHWSFQKKGGNTYLIAASCTSVFGAIVTVFFIITFIAKRNTPVVRSSNFLLSMVQMATHLVLFFLPFLALGEETQAKCIIRTYVSGLLYFTIISLILVKVGYLVSVFGFIHKITKKDKIRVRFKECLVFVCTMVTYVLIIFVIESTYPLTVADEKYLSTFKVYKSCNTRPFSIADISATLIVLVLCAFQSFRGRNLPSEFTNVKYNAFAMFSYTLATIVVIPIGLSLSDPDKFILMSWLKSNVANFLLLTIVYFYKIKIIWFNSKENTVKVFSKKTF